MTEEPSELEAQELPGDSQEQMPATSADVEKLQAEVAQLRHQVSEGEKEKETLRRPWRRVAVALLIVLGCLVLVVGNMAFWARHTVLNTDGWVAAVGPLSKSEIVAEAVSVIVVRELDNVIDIEGVTNEALPENLKPYSGPLAYVIQGLVRDAIAAAVETEQFNGVWVGVNRAVHGALVGVLRGEGSLLYIRDGQATLDLSDLFRFVEDELGLGRLGLSFEDERGQFVLFSSGTLASIQQVVGTLDILGILLPLLAVLAFVIAWFVSLWRRKTLLWIGVGVALTMALSLVLYALLRPLILGVVTDANVRAVAEEIWGIVTQGLIVQTVLVLIIGLLIVLGAWLAGPHRHAVAIRSGTRKQVHRLTSPKEDTA
jgi:hypothetical protein